MLTGYNYHTILKEKVLQAQAKSCLSKSQNQDEDPCPDLPEKGNAVLLIVNDHSYIFAFLAQFSNK